MGRVQIDHCHTALLSRQTQGQRQRLKRRMSLNIGSTVTLSDGIIMPREYSPTGPVNTFSVQNACMTGRVNQPADKHVCLLCEYCCTLAAASVSSVPPHPPMATGVSFLDNSECRPWPWHMEERDGRSRNCCEGMTYDAHVSATPKSRIFRLHPVVANLALISWDC